VEEIDARYEKGAKQEWTGVTRRAIEKKVMDGGKRWIWSKCTKHI